LAGLLRFLNSLPSLLRCVKSRRRERLSSSLVDCSDNNPGHQVARDCGCSPAADAAALASSVGPKDSYDRKLAELSFLAPDIQLAILEGRQPEELSVEKLLDPSPPLGWAQQRRLLEFGSSGL